MTAATGDARQDQFETLELDWSAQRVRVQLNRPAQRNAVNLQMVEELHALLAHLEREPLLLVITGGDEGIFSGGADVGELRDRRWGDALAGINVGLFERLRALPLPTVAAIDGPALGGGAELAYACDIRIATPRASFGQPEVRLGIMAGAGGCFRLAQLVGEGLAKELLFTGRSLSSEQALEARLITRIVDPAELLVVADDLCDQMALGSVAALRLTKLAVNAPLAAHPAIDRAAQAVLFESEDKFERMDAFLARGQGRPVKR